MRVSKISDRRRSLYDGDSFVCGTSRHRPDTLCFFEGEIDRETLRKALPHLIAFAETGSLAIQSDDPSATATRPQN